MASVGYWLEIPFEFQGVDGDVAWYRTVLDHRILLIRLPHPELIDGREQAVTPVDRDTCDVADVVRHLDEVIDTIP